MTAPRVRPVLAILAAFAAAAPALAADPVFPPGSRIGLTPPADMAPARGLSGFRSPKTGAAIVTIEMPAEAYPTMAAGFTDQALKAQGFTVSSRDTPRIEGSPSAILISGEQAETGRSVPKSVLLASEPTMTAMVVGQLAPGASREEVQTLQNALRTVVFRPPLGLDEQLDALPFRLGDRAGFRVVRAIAGNSLLMTDGPSDVIKEAAQPILIVAQSFGPAPAGEQARQTFARSALVSTNFIKDPVVERAQAYRQSGADWHELVARAKDAQSDTPVILMQTIRFEPGGYLRTVGIVRADQRDAVLPRFRAVVDAISLKDE